MFAVLGEFGHRGTEAQRGFNFDLTTEFTEFTEYTEGCFGWRGQPALVGM